MARTHTTAALGRVLEAERPKAAIVFCRTRLDVDAVTENGELGVGDECGHLHQRVVAEIQPRHLTVDPHQSVAHDDSP